MGLGCPLHETVVGEGLHLAIAWGADGCHNEGTPPTAPKLCSFPPTHQALGTQCHGSGGTWGGQALMPPM